MSRKVYIAGRANRAKEFQNLCDEIERLGYSVVSRWFDDVKANRPYRGNIGEVNQGIIKSSLRQASSADIFILFSEPGMRGTYVEMGAFLSSVFQTKKTYPKMYIIGGKEETHIFESAPFAKFINNKQQLLTMLTRLDEYI